MRIGVFGGTFNPIHHGHIYAIAHCIHKVNLDKVYVMVAGDPYHKEQPEVSAMQRFEWVKLACKEFFDPSIVIVDDREVNRDGPTYTIDTIKELTNRHEDDQIILLIGDDVVDTIDTWKDIKELHDLVEIFVVSRSVFATSSSAIRELRGNGDPITGLVSPAIESEILANNIYNR